MIVRRQLFSAWPVQEAVSDVTAMPRPSGSTLELGYAPRAGMLSPPDAMTNKQTRLPTAQ